MKAASEIIYGPFSKDILAAIGAAEDIVVIGHSNPDGDCIFSQLALGRVLTALGKKVTLLNEGPFARDEIAAYGDCFLTEAPSSLVAKKPLVIVVDCSTIDRPGTVIDPFKDCTIVVLDHHSSGEPFTDEKLMYIQPLSVSTTLIVDALREALGVPLDVTMASYIYKGFVTDTGFFHFISDKVAGETLRRVSALVDQGVSPYSIYDEMHDGKTLAYFKGVATLVDRVQSRHDGALLYTWQKDEDGFSGKPADDIYSQLLQVEGVRVVLFFKQNGDMVDIGMRSKNGSGIDIGSFASRLGGGGHRYAAGAKVKGGLDEIMKRTIEDLASVIMES